MFMDIMSFVFERWDLVKIDRKKALQADPLTYHAPCHLKNNFATADRVLQKIKEIQYIASDDMVECCGGGGTFFYEYPEISGRLAQRKIDTIRKTDAKLWLTDCPVCRLNLAGQLVEGDAIRLSHPVQFIY